MPKKTKREKVLAAQRKAKQVSITYSPELKTLPQDKRISHSIKENVETMQSAEYFKHDFKKSLFIILAIFALEIAIYFASMSNYVSRLLGL